MESKTFYTGNVRGIKQAEAYKRKLEAKYDRVVTRTVGLNRVQIEGNPTDVKVENHGSIFLARPLTNQGVQALDALKN